MAFADPTQHLPDDELKSLSERLSRCLSGAPLENKIEKVGLGESFAIWQIDPLHFHSTPPFLPTAASRLWHYQIFLDRKPIAHALVYQADSQLKIYNVTASLLAERVDQAIEWIDKYDKDNTGINFLVVPSRLVYAFRLVQSDVVYVISAPATPQRAPTPNLLGTQMVLSTNEFLLRLRLSKSDHLESHCEERIEFQNE